jgi:hypothetical protein
MMRRKIISLFLFGSLVLTNINDSHKKLEAAAVSYEPSAALYDNFIKAQKAHLQTNGESAQDNYYYQKNSSNAKYKKPEELSGYISENDLERKGGKYIRKVKMTYKEYINLGIEDGLRYDIDPERMVWVFTSRFSGQHEVGDRLIDKGEVTSVYDAETGDFLSVRSSGATVSGTLCDCKRPKL